MRPRRTRTAAPRTAVRGMPDACAPDAGTTPQTALRTPPSGRPRFAASRAPPRGCAAPRLSPPAGSLRGMAIRRVVPDIKTESFEASRVFYERLGFEEVMNLGWVMALAAPGNPTAQLIFMDRDASAPVEPDMSIEVEDVDAAHEAMRAAGAEIVHPLTDEEWGVRRFFVRDPNGQVVNVVAHRG